MTIGRILSFRKKIKVLGKTSFSLINRFHVLTIKLYYTVNWKDVHPVSAKCIQNEDRARYDAFTVNIINYEI